MTSPTRRPAFLGQTALAGVGYTPFTKRSGRSVLALATEACKNAIADAGLAPGTVDCLERELARVLAGLTDGVDAARAFDVSLTLPRRGGG